MAAKVIPWSHSSLNAYETCPHRYEQERILRVIPKRSYKEAQEGIDKHKAIENYLKAIEKLEDPKLKALVDKTLYGLDPSFMQFEHKLGVTKDLQPCDYNSPDAYHRCIIDVLYVHPNDDTGRIFDWKNGKVNEYSDQLKSNAICVLAHHPHLSKVLTEYVWMNHGKTTPGRVFREFVSEIWPKYVRRVDRLENALACNIWPKRPGGLCKKYCPVVSCEHNGEFTRG